MKKEKESANIIENKEFSRTLKDHLNGVNSKLAIELKKIREKIQSNSELCNAMNRLPAML